MTIQQAVPQYYVEHSHDPIIRPDEWEKVQLELARRRHSTRRTQCNSPFAGKIICGDCGEIFGSKVWHSTSKYRRTVWRCNAKYEVGDPCHTPHIYEDDLKAHFLTALGQLLADRTALLEDGKLVREEMLNCKALETEIQTLQRELDVVAGMIQRLVDENAKHPLPQDTYLQQYNDLVERYEILQDQYYDLEAQLERRRIQAEAVCKCLDALEALDLPQLAFTDSLWNTAIDHVTVFADKRLMFHFKNGSEVEVKVCK